MGPYEYSCSNQNGCINVLVIPEPPIGEATTSLALRFQELESQNTVNQLHPGQR